MRVPCRSPGKSNEEILFKRKLNQNAQKTLRELISGKDALIESQKEIHLFFYISITIISIFRVDFLKYLA